MQIDDLLVKLDNVSVDMERLKEEKDQEIAILQEGMDSTIQQLHDSQQVYTLPMHNDYHGSHSFTEPRHL